MRDTPRGARWLLLLPASYLLHLAEEWWGGEGFASWTQRAVGAPLSETRFLIVNGIAAPLFILGTVLAITKPRWEWAAVSLATIVFINGILHVLGTVATRSYSPGVVTGVVLYLPLGFFALRWSRERVPPTAFTDAVAAGIIIHAVVVIIAFWR